MTSPSKPDLSALVKSRLATPREMRIEADAAAIGAAILRQLLPNSAPGGDYPLRMSSLGSCAKALAFKFRGVPPDGRVIDGRARATFAMGDMAEQLLVTTLADSIGELGDGWKLSGYREEGQALVSLDVELPEGTVTIPGHPDGTIEGPQGFRAVLEVKSASSYGFSRWEKAIRDGVDPWTPEEGYWFQVQGYMHATVTDLAYVLALCKDSGAIMGFWIRRDPHFMSMITKHLNLVTTTDPASAPRMLPNGEILGPVAKLSKKTGAPLKGHNSLHWRCAYCSHFRVCFGGRLDEKVETDYRGRPSRKLYLRA